MAVLDSTTAPRPPSVTADTAPERLDVPREAGLRAHMDPANLRSFALSTPGRLIAIGLLLIGLCLGAGMLTATTVSDRQQGLDILLDDTEPDANSSHHLYTSLSIADAAASTAFIAGGLEPEAVRNRYSQALGEASAELVTQSGHAAGQATSNDNPDTRLRTGIATGLPVYSGLIETARANNRNGYPVGAAYLSEASNQMQTTLLPMAAQLQSHRFDAVSAAQRHHVQPPWPAVAVLILALGTLVWAQFGLSKRWHRVLNPGLLLASTAMLILLAWTVTAGSISAAEMIEGRDHGAVPSSRLTESRILTQQARSAETLKLVRRDATGDYDRTYESSVTRLNELLNGYPSDAPAASEIANARDSLIRGRAAHQRMNDSLAHGDFVGAATVATGPGAADAAAQMESLDRALGEGLDATRDTLRENISGAARSLHFLAPGALALGILAAVYVGLGIWPRLREYR